MRTTLKFNPSPARRPDCTAGGPANGILRHAHRNVVLTGDLYPVFLVHRLFIAALVSLGTH